MLKKINYHGPHTKQPSHPFPYSKYLEFLEFFPLVFHSLSVSYLSFRLILVSDPSKDAGSVTL